MDRDFRYDRIAGTLLGTALGDALGLPAEGMSARAIARRFGTVDRFHLLGPFGFVSDDTEQTALVAQALVAAPADLDRALRLFRRGLLGWFWRLPWGIGRATIRACCRITLGLQPSGVRSAGNGSAMRSSIIGAFFWDQPARRREWARAFSEVTHRDHRAVEGAGFAAGVAALAVAVEVPDRFALIAAARAELPAGELARAIDQAMQLATEGATIATAAATTGRSGYVVSTLALASFLFLRWGDDPARTWAEGIALGGDTDTVAAIVGGWMGASHGEARLPAHLIDRIHDGPFGPTHLRRLARALVESKDGGGHPPPRYSRTAALARNVALYPVILAHGLRRVIPF